MLDNGPQDEADLALVVHKRNPDTGLTGQKWRITLPDAKAGEPAWFETARAARATVRAYAVEHKDDILQALLDVDGRNTNVLLQTDAELEEFEALPKDSSDEDSDDAAKENAGAARAAKAAPKPVKAKAATKKRAASDDCEADDSDFQDDTHKPKRAYVRKAAAKEADPDVDFDAAVAAAAVTFSKKVLGGMRKTIMNLGLYDCGPDMRERVRCELSCSLVQRCVLIHAAPTDCNICCCSCAAQVPRQVRQEPRRRQHRRARGCGYAVPQGAARRGAHQGHHRHTRGARGAGGRRGARGRRRRSRGRRCVSAHAHWPDEQRIALVYSPRRSSCGYKAAALSHTAGPASARAPAPYCVARLSPRRASPPCCEPRR